MNIYSDKRHVARIHKSHPCSDNYRSAEPWLLLHNSGRVDRFASYREARDEARKSYAGAKLSRA